MTHFPASWDADSSAFPSRGELLLYCLLLVYPFSPYATPFYTYTHTYIYPAHYLKQQISQNISQWYSDFSFTSLYAENALVHLIISVFATPLRQYTQTHSSIELHHARQQSHTPPSQHLPLVRTWYNSALFLVTVTQGLFLLHNFSILSLSLCFAMSGRYC